MKLIKNETNMYEFEKATNQELSKLKIIQVKGTDMYRYKNKKNSQVVWLTATPKQPTIRIDLALDTLSQEEARKMFAQTRTLVIKALKVIESEYKN